MSDHTPGPWSVHPVSKTTVMGSDRRTICVAHGRGVMGTGDPAANARLIASAPDMAARIATLEAENRDLGHEIDVKAERLGGLLGLLAECDAIMKEYAGTVNVSDDLSQRIQEELAHD